MTHLIKPYGDTMNDAKYTFVHAAGGVERSGRRSRTTRGEDGLRRRASGGRPLHCDRFSFFVVYASTPHAIDFAMITAPSAKTHAMTMEEVDALIAERMGRNLRVAGACIGTDAHTVGIDAILNMKGYKGDYG